MGEIGQGIKRHKLPVTKHVSGRDEKQSIEHIVNKIVKNLVTNNDHTYRGEH